MSRLISAHEIAVDGIDDAIAICNVLLHNEYVVMLSREENLYIINYEYSEHADRNNVVFLDRSVYEEEEDRYLDEMCKDCRRNDG